MSNIKAARQLAGENEPVAVTQNRQPNAGAIESRPRESAGDAAKLQSFLRQQFANDAPAFPSIRPSVELTRPLSPISSRILKSVAGLVIVAAVGWMPMQRLFQVASVEAVINASVISLKSPIDGIVDANLDTMKVGGIIQPGTALVAVENSRVDSGFVERAREQLASTAEELAELESKLSYLNQAAADAKGRVEAYRRDRIARLIADLGQADARLAAERANNASARFEFVRQSKLARSGAGALAAREIAERNLSVSVATIAGIRSEKAALSVELDALYQGRFFGDSYNDEPRSVQRLAELDDQIISAKAERARLHARATRTQVQMDRETARFENASRAKVMAMTGGQIWEVSTAPGEQVSAGQQLVSLLNCSQLLVTATVNEAVYNTLSLGTPAHFTFREGGDALGGRVVQLTGVGSVSSNLAIVPSALTKGSYRVAVAIDGATTNAGACPVGRTGRVVFDNI